MIRLFLWWQGIFILSIGIIWVSCAEDSVEKNSEISRGEILARQYCGSCHEFVAPEHLSKNYWQSVLVRMSANLGLKKLYYGNTAFAKKRLTEAHIFPDTPVISMSDWVELTNYFLDNAPDTLDQGSRPEINYPLPLFAPKAIPWKSNLNGLTYLKIKEKNQILAGYNYQGDSNKLHLIDLEGHSLSELALPSTITDMKIDQKTNLNYLVCMGPFEADDTPVGAVLLNTLSASGGDIKNHKIVLSQRERPVYLSVIDLDHDGQDDLLLSEFGKFLGGLNWYKQDQEGKWIKNTLYPGPGALTTQIRDVNNDGLPDIFALLSQGNEGINLYINQGNGQFETRSILKFPPYYGSVHFELFDFDSDGQEDIIYINGDSGDFGHPAKPFHGIRFYKNMGHLKYEEKWFYPQQGTYDLAIADFDEDGDPDIASIGFFAKSTGMPQEGFLYLKNPGQIHSAHDFKTYSFAGADQTSFMVMDHGDIDGDGDIDIILGASASIMTVKERIEQLTEWQEKGGAIYLLENLLHQHEGVRE